MSADNNYDSDGPEPIITTPQSPGSEIESSPSPPSLRYDLVKSSKPTVISPDGYSSETSISKKSEGKLIKSREIVIEQGETTKNIESRFESNGKRSSEVSTCSKYQRQDARQIKTGELVSSQLGSSKSSAFKVNSESLLQSNKATYKSQKSVRHEEKNVSSTTSSTMSSTRFVKSTHLSSSSAVTSSQSSSAVEESPDLDELEYGKSKDSIDMSLQLLGLTAYEGKLFCPKTPEEDSLPGCLIAKIVTKFSSLLEKLKSKENVQKILEDLNCIIGTAGSKHFNNHDLYKKLCDVIRSSHALDILIENCGDQSIDQEIRYQSAHLLEQSLSPENLAHVVEKGFAKVVGLACDFAKTNATVHERTGTAILSKLFTVSEETCKDVIKKGGLKAIVYKCRSTDDQTLRHCASALANLSVYGGPENHSSMIEEKAPAWLFPLARQPDEDTAYYACLAIAVLVANKEIEATVLSSGTPQLIELFICKHSPEDFLYSDLHSRGQSKEWLKRLALVLESDREEARSLAAFHFAVEAYIKAKQGKAAVSNRAP